MVIEKSNVSWVVFLRRTLAVLFLPLLAVFSLATLIALVGSWGQSSGILYMRSEALFFSAIPFALAILAALIVKWTISKKAALVIFILAVCGVLVFVGTAAVFETSNTKPIVSAANSFKELQGLTREMKNNGDKFSPAPSGFIPCIDLMGEGCPNVTRAWIAPDDREFTVVDLQKVLDDSGWKDVKIQKDSCDMRDRKNSTYPDCSAEGMVGDYKATVRIVKISDHWELRMYLRLPTNVR